MDPTNPTPNNGDSSADAPAADDAASAAGPSAATANADDAGGAENVNDNNANNADADETSDHSSDERMVDMVIAGIAPGQLMEMIVANNYALDDAAAAAAAELDNASYDEESEEDVDEHLMEDDEGREEIPLPDINEVRRRLRTERGPALFDTELPAQHSYLGALNPISGTTYLEPNSSHHMPLFGHSQIVFPGEEVPMIFNQQDAEHLRLGADHNGSRSGGSVPDGANFGLFFKLDGARRFYGVTCQVFEMASSDDGIVRVKVLAKQRFVITRKLNADLQLFNPASTPQTIYISRRQVAHVTVLPEIDLPDPLFGYDTNSWSKLRSSGAALPQTRLRQRWAASSPWPRFVYDLYNWHSVVRKVMNFLLAMDVEIANLDPVAMSFWCAKNVLLHNSDRLQIFETNSVTKRMYIISKSLHYMRYFICCECKAKIAHFSAIFAMSKQNVQTNFCNPAGYVHETNTVLCTVPNAVYLQGLPCAQFSWFPGYAWQIAACNRCNGHIGWKFTVAPGAGDLLPRQFYGLSGGRVRIRMVRRIRGQNGGADDDVDEAAAAEEDEEEEAFDADEPLLLDQQEAG